MKRLHFIPKHKLYNNTLAAAMSVHLPASSNTYKDICTMLMVIICYISTGLIQEKPLTELFVVIR